VEGFEAVRWEWECDKEFEWEWEWEDRGVGLVVVFVAIVETWALSSGEVKGPWGCMCIIFGDPFWLMVATSVELAERKKVFGSFLLSRVGGWLRQSCRGRQVQVVNEKDLKEGLGLDDDDDGDGDGDETGEAELQDRAGAGGLPV
jgi:hypothetical protein